MGLNPFARLIITASRSGVVAADDLESFSRTIIEPGGRYAADLSNIEARPRSLT